VSYPTAPPPPPGPGGPYGQPAAPQGTDRTTLFGILGIVLSLCCWPAGVVFAILSITQSKKYSSSPVLGYVGIALAAVVLIINIIVLATGNNPYMSGNS